MTDEKWRNTWELFRRLRELPRRDCEVVLADPTLDMEVVSELRELLETSRSASASYSIPPDGENLEPVYRPGHDLGRYAILGIIGCGGSGEIYLARDKELGRVVALKCLTKKPTHDAGNLVDEARAASALNHPNIVTVYEVIHVGDRIAIAMEFVEGSPLRKLCGTPMSPEMIARYGSQVAEALAVTHAVGIVHGDIKPENIIVRPDGYVKVLDFGLARRLDGQAKTRGGTLRYMSPEMLRGEPSSQAGDTFSFGLVLYEMATGSHAFPGGSQFDTADAITERDPVAPVKLAPELTRGLNDLILSMLAKKSGQRPSVSQVAESLHSEIPRRVESGRRRVRVALWSAARLLAGAFVVSILYWLSRPTMVRLHPRPLTGERGFESSPSLSPLGQFVIYKWRAKAADQDRVFLLRVGSDKPTVLPIDGDKAGPFAWRPDGGSIAFLSRGNEKNAVYSIDPDGTNQQRIFTLNSGSGNTLDWSPDGKTIAYADISKSSRVVSIFLHSLATGERRQVTWPPASSDGDSDVAFSPDSRKIAFRRNFTLASGDVFLTELRNPKTARQVTYGAKRGEAIAWTRDGKGLVLSVENDASLSLWFRPLSTPGAISRLTELGHRATSLKAALLANRLVWVNALDDTNIWCIPTEGGTPVQLIGSAFRDQDVSAARTGRLAFRSDRSGFSEIWISDRLGNSQTRVTSLEAFTGSPRWSPDARHLAFDSRRTARSNILILDCESDELRCGSPRQITDDPAIAVLPNWSRDGNSVYFASQRSGVWEVWKVPATGGQAVAVTTKGGYFASESLDGEWLYYSRLGEGSIQGLWRKAIRPGRFSSSDVGEMILPMDYSATATWALWGDEVIFERFFPSEEIQAFNLTTRKTRTIYTPPERILSRGLAVTHDGNSVLFTQLDRADSNVIIADYEYVH